MVTKRGQLLTGDNRQANVVEAETMTQLWNRANDSIIWADADDLAYASSLDSMITDCMGIARKATFEIDIGADLWVTPSRWNTLIRQYVDPDRLFLWLERVKEISTYQRGIVAMDMNPVKHQVVKSNARASRRKGGGCMRMITYRAFPQPTVTLFSRTSYLGYVGGLDMLCGYKLIETACDMIGDGLKPEQFQFVWMCDTWQFHGFKSMAYIIASKQDLFMRISEEKWAANVGRKMKIHGVVRKLKPLDSYPTWKLIRYWYNRLAKQDAEGKLYREMKYGAEKRIRRRFHAATGVNQDEFLDGEKEYAPLTTPIELITLDRMLYKTPESRAVIRKQKLAKAEKLLSQLFDDDEADILMLDQL